MNRFRKHIFSSMLAFGLCMAMASPVFASDAFFISKANLDEGKTIKTGKYILTTDVKKHDYRIQYIDKETEEVVGIAEGNYAEYAIGDNVNWRDNDSKYASAQQWTIEDNYISANNIYILTLSAYGDSRDDITKEVESTSGEIVNVKTARKMFTEEDKGFSKDKMSIEEGDIFKPDDKIVGQGYDIYTVNYWVNGKKVNTIDNFDKVDFTSLQKTNFEYKIENVSNIQEWDFIGANENNSDTYTEYVFNIGYNTLKTEVYPEELEEESAALKVDDVYIGNNMYNGYSISKNGPLPSMVDTYYLDNNGNYQAQPVLVGYYPVYNIGGQAMLLNNMVTSQMVNGVNQVNGQNYIQNSGYQPFYFNNPNNGQTTQYNSYNNQNTNNTDYNYNNSNSENTNSSGNNSSTGGGTTLHNGIVVNNERVSSNVASSSHNHLYEWRTTKIPTDDEIGERVLICANCGDIKQTITGTSSDFLVFNFMNKIKNAPRHSTVEIDTGNWYVLSDTMIYALRDRPDVNVKLKFIYKGKHYILDIPCNSNYNCLFTDNEDCYGYFGFASYMGLEVKEDTNVSSSSAEEESTTNENIN